jgi:hypothetical protein
MDSISTSHCHQADRNRLELDEEEEPEELVGLRLEACQQKRIFIVLMTSDRRSKASREGFK